MTQVICPRVDCSLFFDRDGVGLPSLVLVGCWSPGGDCVCVFVGNSDKLLPELKEGRTGLEEEAL
eukprot:5765908-Pyramimonas_sp.AAC.1